MDDQSFLKEFNDDLLLNFRDLVLFITSVSYHNNTISGTDDGLFLAKSAKIYEHRDRKIRLTLSPTLRAKRFSTFALCDTIKQKKNRPEN